MTYFGSTDSVLDTLLNSTDIDSPHYNKALETYLSKNPLLEKLINPNFELYYGPGGPGGYGENLRKRFIGYSGLSIEGIEKILEVKTISVPFIQSPEAFQSFISNTPTGSRSIAMLMPNPVLIPNYPSSHYIYAIIYEKTKDCDNLYLYDSDALAENAYMAEDLAPYFRDQFCLLYPDRPHHVYNEICLTDTQVNASVIEDIAILLENSRYSLDVSSMPSTSFFSQRSARDVHAKEKPFSLSSAFDYDEKTIRRNQLIALINLNEAGLLIEKSTSALSVI